MKHRLHFAILLIFLSVTTPVQARESLLDIQEVVSAGGLKAWLVEDHSIPVIAMEYGFVDAGAKNDTLEKQGTAQMLSNTMDEGAGDLNSQAFQKQLRDLSISLHFDASRDHFSGTLKTLTQNKARAFELLKLALTRPRFDEDPVNRMRAANQSRIRSALSDPEWIAARILNDTAFAGHVYAQNSGGTLSSLEKIGPDDLRAFHAAYLGKNNLKIAVAGDITAEELKTTLDQVFGALPVINMPQEAPPAALHNQGRITLYKKDIPQTIISIMQPGIDRQDPDYHTAQVMNFILGSSGFGSRLMKEVREERGLTYGIYSYFLDMDHFDGLGVSTSTENKNAAEILSLVKKEWNRMKKTPVRETELNDAQSYLTGSLPLSLTSTDQIAGLLLSLQLDDLSIDYLDLREKAIENTTAQDVQRVAQELLNADAFTTILVGKPENITADQTLDKLPNAE